MHTPITDADGLCGFLPSADRARKLDARMRARLAESVRSVSEQTRDHIAIPDAKIVDFQARAGSGPLPPLVFGAYYDLVLALESGALSDASALFDEILAPIPARGDLRVSSLEADPRPGSKSRYQRLFNTDETSNLELNPPSAEAAAGYRAKVVEALAYLDHGTPTLAAEIRTLIGEIVLASGASDPGSLRFGGVSSFMLWGALALNVDFPLTTVEMVESLAHESAHNLLFGLSIDGPLLRNGVLQRYVSPLREDPRHLDGIYHATFVTARMHLALSELLGAGVFDRNEEAAARNALRTNEMNFGMGLETVVAHAQLTPVGAKVLTGAREYMESAKSTATAAVRPA